MTYTITLTDEEETSLKKLIAWNLEGRSKIGLDTQTRERIYEKLLKSERQEA